MINFTESLPFELVNNYPKTRFYTTSNSYASDAVHRGAQDQALQRTQVLVQPRLVHCTQEAKQLQPVLQPVIQSPTQGDATDSASSVARGNFKPEFSIFFFTIKSPTIYNLINYIILVSSIEIKHTSRQLGLYNNIKPLQHQYLKGQAKHPQPLHFLFHLDQVETESIWDR